MAAQSIETQTLNECYPALVECVQQSPASLADRLRGLLPPATLSYLRNPHHNNDDKAREILDTVQSQLSTNRAVFKKFVKALQDAGDWTKSALRKVNDTYKRLIKETPEFRALLKHEQEITATWKEEISRRLAKTLSLDKSLKRPHTQRVPPETVEEYYSAVLESIVETDCVCYDEFLTVLGTLGEWGATWVSTLQATTEELRTAQARKVQAVNTSLPPVSSQVVSTKTQAITLIPPKLQVDVPTHCTTIKATPTSEDAPLNKDEKFTLQVTVRDSSTGKPLDCLVGLLGDSKMANQSQLVCYLSLAITNTDRSSQNGDSGWTRTDSVPEYRIWRSRRSGYSPNGQATFYTCFYKAYTNYIVTLGVAKIIDEDGIECIGYTVEHYTGFVSTYRTVERGAFKTPSLRRYEGEIASSKFNNLMSMYHKMFYKGRPDITKMIIDKMTGSGSTASLDIKLYMHVIRTTEKPYSLQSITILEGILRELKSMECRNSFLLEGDIMIALSYIHALQGSEDKALQYTNTARSICLEVAPSRLTSFVFLNHARNTIYANKGNLTVEVKRRILELFDRAIADSYYGVGWERLMIFNAHIYKALFCLNGVIDVNIHSTPDYTPSPDDISLAEQHLGATPLEEVHDIHMNIVIYYIAISDLHRWKGEKSKSREYAERAKSLCVEKKFISSHTIEAIDVRLELLGADTMDEVLEMLGDIESTVFVD